MTNINIGKEHGSTTTITNHSITGGSRAESWKQEFQLYNCHHCKPPVWSDEPTALAMRIQKIQRSAMDEAIWKAFAELVQSGVEYTGAEASRFAPYFIIVI